MQAERLSRKLGIAAAAAVLGCGIGLAGAHAAHLLTGTGCLQDGGGFVTSNGGCTDTKTGLTWSLSYMENHASAATWNQASSYCSSLVEGGYSGWHLPRLSELNGMSLDGGASYLQLASPSFPLWSSTTQGNKAYAVTPATDGSAYFLKGSGLDFVCVR